MSMIDDVRFWAQVVTDSERTWLCSPELESRLKCMVEACGLSGLITVKASPFIPDDQVIVMDEHAIEADHRQWMTKPIQVIPESTRNRWAEDLAALDRAWRNGEFPQVASD